MPFSLYNLTWPDGTNRSQIERHMIRQGGQWTTEGAKFGLGLFHHYRELQTAIWPEEMHNRWSDLMLREFIQNTITAVIGPKDSGKTRTASKFALTDYYCWPDCTLILISSTDLRGLEVRVWGDLKSLHDRAMAHANWIPGHVLESKHAILTDDVDDGEIRDMRKGIICIPCMSSGGQFIGISKYVGIKQKRRRLIGDEASLMKEGFLESIANLNSGDFKGVFLGNPLGQDDPLDKVSEPKEGWDSLPEPTKTTTWDNRWIGGRTINLVGTDSPNFDYPANEPLKFPFLINQKSIDAVAAFYGNDSHTYFSQCKGVRRAGLDARRVLTRAVCEQFHAFDPVIWSGTPLTKVVGLDAAYGSIGGDRCIIQDIEFGVDVDGAEIIACSPPIVVPVSVNKRGSPEDQIAKFLKDHCEQRGVPPENVGFDSTGRGSLGTAIARIWSASIEPVEFGGRATMRPVSNDLLIWDSKEAKKRPKRCDEEYSKFVTELWFSVGLCVKSGQMRALPPEVAKDFYAREWMTVSGNRTEIEPKSDTKKRMGRSPDCADACVVAVEIARRRGFKIRRIANQDQEPSSLDWLDKITTKSIKLRSRNVLNHAA